MGYRRGFKTEANSIGEEVRGELGLTELDPLDPRDLARHLSIPVLDLSEFIDVHPGIACLQTTEKEAFSAVTVFDGTARTIVHNDGHSLSRQNSNLAHELAHGLLLHPPTPALDDKGCREWNQDVEDEATWLAGILLVTEVVTLEIARGRLTREVARERYGVSKAMLQFRINATGAVKRVQRARAGRYRSAKV